MTGYLADLALIGGKFSPNVRIDIAADGSGASLVPGGEGGDRIAGCVVPGGAQPALPRLPARDGGSGRARRA